MYSGNCALAVTYTVQDVACFGDSTVAIFEISNGIPPFTISDPNIIFRLVPIIIPFRTA